jgi:serine beta-lactamase-like protein LACTB
MRRRWFLVLAAAAAAAAQPLTRERIGEIEKAITEEMSRQGIPALSVSVATGGEWRWSNGYGYSDVENNVPAKASTAYRLGSISKPITAVAAMQLYEKGRLDLDAPVQKYVPSFPQKPWPISTRQLLSHLGGIRHYNSEDEVNSTRRYLNLSDPLAIFQRDPLVAEPGTRYNYTTYGYVLLGAAVEAAAGARFMDYLRDNIFTPAGMTRIAADDVHAIIPNRARGYRRYATGQLENCALADTSNKLPGGGMISTVDDLTRFALAIRQGKLVKPETAALMFTRQKLRDGSETPYGLGWNVGRFDGRQLVLHTGGQQGTSTVLAMLPREGVVVALMCNLERGGLVPLGQRIARMLLE